MVEAGVVVKGKYGTKYHCASVEAIDDHLDQLRKKISVEKVARHTLEFDIDALLDARLQFAEFNVQ